MWLQKVLTWMFDGVSVGGVLTACFIGLAVCFFFAFWWGKEFFAVSAVCVIGFFGIVGATSFDGRIASMGLSTLFEASAICYGAQALAWRFRKKRAAAAQKRIREREERFSVPDREHSFIKERLRTQLSVPSEKDEEGFVRASVRKKCAAKTEFALGLLKKLQIQQLSAGDRLDADSLKTLLTVYAAKDGLKPIELRALNDGLSRVLRLASKYAL